MCLTGFIAPAQAAVTSNPIDTNSRYAVSTAYKAKYVPATSTPIDWNGNTSTCTPGTQSAASKTQANNVINFYRGLSGLDSISLDTALNTRAQSTALMMQANESLSHYPPSTWKCYTSAGATGAGRSNLFGGYWSSGSMPSAATPIDAYMEDSGDNNHAAGHRRWILEPSTVTMGLGTTSRYNALEVIGTKTATDRATPAFIPFPNAGYSPSQLEPNGRWSLSSTQGADFSTATVTVKSGSTTLPVTKYPVANGYGPNTLVFEVQGISRPTGTAEAAYTVTVNNIKKDGKVFSHTYTTRLFDGTVSGTAPAPAVVNSINSSADIVAYDANGTLWNYGTLNPSTGRKQINSVLPASIPKNLFVTDWNADGIYDLITQTKDGYIHFHKGLKGGGFATSAIGNGWQAYDITVAKWKTVDKYPSIIARNNTSGELFNYTNPAGSTLGSRVKIGAGWNGYTFNILDWDKDGRQDIVARNSAGAMKLYRSNGAGTLINETRATIGSGWNTMNHIKTVNGHNGAGTVGLTARDASGTLWYYQANKSSWAARKQIGAGWGSYLISGN